MAKTPTKKTAGKRTKARTKPKTKRGTGAKKMKMTAGRTKTRTIKAKTTVTRGKHKSQPTNGSNVIWKFLEMKEARRREMAAAAEANRSRGNQSSDGKYGQHQGFARFSGPRRRAA